MSEQDAASTAVAPVGALGLGVVPLLFTSPSEGFRRLGADPQWIGQFLLVLVLIASAVPLRFPQDMAFQRDVAVQGAERRDVSEADIDKMVARIPDPDTMTGAEVAVRASVSVATFAALSFVGLLVFWLIAAAAGAQPGFRRASAAFWTAQVPRAVGALVLALLVHEMDTVEVSLSPAVLFPGLEWGSVRYALLNVFDVFSVASLYCLAAGAHRTLATSRISGWIIGGVYWTLASVLGLVPQLAVSWAMGRL